MIWLLLLEKPTGHVATLKSWQTSKIKVSKTPKYKKKIRNRELLLSTILLKNKAEN